MGNVQTNVCSLFRQNQAVDEVFFHTTQPHLLDYKGPLCAYGLLRFLFGDDRIFKGIFCCCIYKNQDPEKAAVKEVFKVLLGNSIDDIILSDERQLLNEIRSSFSNVLKYFPATKETLEFVELIPILVTHKKYLFIYILFLCFLWGFQDGYYDSANHFITKFKNFPKYELVEKHATDIQIFLRFKPTLIKQKIDELVLNIEKMLQLFLSEQFIDITSQRSYIEGRVVLKKLYLDLINVPGIFEAHYRFRLLNFKKILESKAPNITIFYKLKCTSQNSWEWMGCYVLLRMIDLTDVDIRLIKRFKPEKKPMQMCAKNFYVEHMLRTHAENLSSLDIETIAAYTYLIMNSKFPDIIRYLAVLNADEKNEECLEFFRQYLADNIVSLETNNVLLRVEKLQREIDLLPETERYEKFEEKRKELVKEVIAKERPENKIVFY